VTIICVLTVSIYFNDLQGSTQPILSDVAYAVAHKLKSAIMSAAR
jgi:hypothetical protein